MKQIKICRRCVMDTTDSGISFDENGYCDNCRRFNRDIIPIWEKDKSNNKKFYNLVKEIKKKGKNKKYDCIIGLSGGLDSSYLLHLVVTEFNLRPLVFHVDGGWNSDLAVSNIQNIVDKLDLELMTEVINWKEMRDLQLSFFKSGVSHIDLPQDHAFVAALYKFAYKNNIKYILNGGNYSTEGIRNPFNWGWFGTDIPHIMDIHKKFGKVKLKTFPLSGVLFHKLFLRLFKGIKVVKPLNYFTYTKKNAENILSKKYNWRPYQQKHFESRFTKFYEGYWMIERFGFDTRKPQFSSLIVSGQMSRDEALKRLKNRPYPMIDVEKDFDFISSKLRISVNELKSYLKIPIKTYKDYKNQEMLFKIGSKLWEFFKFERGVKRI